MFGKEMWPGGRLTAWADRPDVSLMMGQFFGLLIASIFIFKNKMQKIAIVMFILSFTIFILAGNRSPILAISSVFILMIFFSTYRKYILLLFGLFILIFSMSLLNPKLKTAYGSFLNLSNSQSTSGRYELFDVGFEMIKDNPILGIGSHNYKHKFREYFEKIDINKYENKTYIEIYSKSNVSHVHSVFLDIVISYGLLGTIIFLLVIFNIYKTFVKNNEIGLLASIGFLYCLTPFQFARSFTMGDWQFITYLGLIFLALISQYKYLETREKNYEKNI
ncbi:MAG: O-antigen ligase family protein [Aliarcobacter sp.]|nr:O-antigen ligase family protein [Aliarcobacter sp.]